ncbi:PH domain-containing protein [Bacillus paramycoides]|uniref:PH domain-containing protein n=1 Tax=Bacillus paramycoides TaxID=2026194 RepID=UPI003CFD7259
MENVLNQAKKVLHNNEEILSFISCSLETFIYRVVPRPGVLILTDKRLFFYGPDIAGNELFEEYSYDKISSIKEEKNIFGNKILIKYDNDWVKIKYIQSKDPSMFVQKIRETIQR